MANTADVLIWGAQLETGSTATDYQRVVTAFDVTEAGVPSRSYLSFDGSDDGMLTGNIVPGTDKAQVFAGVRKLSDVNRTRFVNFNGNGNNAFNGWAPAAAGATSIGASFFGNSGAGLTVIDTTVTAPSTSVLAATGDLAAPLGVLKVNGVQQATSTAATGGGVFATATMGIGQRNDNAERFNGQIFGLIVRFGANLPAATITQTETWMGQRTSPTVNVPLWQSKTIYDRFEDTVLDRNNETIEVR